MRPPFGPGVGCYARPIASPKRSPAISSEAVSARPAGDAGPALARGGYRRWNIAWVAFLSTGLPTGIAGYAFGVFVAPLEAEFGWSRSEINFSLSLGLIASLLAFPVGSLIDRFGSRPVMFVSLMTTASGLLLSVYMQELWHLYLASVLIYAGQPGATALAVGRLIGLWFPRTRGRMMGLAMAGNNFGGITMVSLATIVVSLAGWRYAYLTFACLIGLLAVAVLVFISDRPAAEARKTASTGVSPPLRGMSVRQALRTPSFYLITAGLTATSFTFTAVLSQMIPHLTNEGFTAGNAASAVMTVAFFGFGSKLVFGRLSERIGARYAAVISLLIQSTGLVILVLAGGSQLAWLGVIVFGMGFGAVGALIPLNIGEAFGLKHFGSLLGIISLVGVIPVVLGPIMAGWIFERTGHYTLSFEITIVIFLFAAACMVFAQQIHRPDAADGGIAVPSTP